MFQISHNQLNQKTWDGFVLEHGPRSGQFLQSFGWGEFSGGAGSGSAGVKSDRGQVDRIAWMSGDKIVAIAQVIRRKLPGFGTYAYIPRGPIEISRAKTDEDFIADAADVANQDLFVRVESLCLQVTGKSKGLTVGTIPLQPAHTLITDLEPSEKQLLANMHEKTRYNIKLAEKKGVQIEIGTAKLDEVWPVFEMTSSRDAFRLHGKEYYKKMLEHTNAFLAVAKHDGEILAANILIDFGKTRTYLHGASSNVKRNFMAPYLLQWELMKNAKSSGFTFYDWWGIAPADAPSTHEWAGITRFKRGFGGEEVSYPYAYDVVLHPVKYMLYKVLRLIRRRIT